MKANMENLKNYLSNKLNVLMILAVFIFSLQFYTLFTDTDASLKVNYIKKEMSKIEKEVKQIYESKKDLNKKIDTFNLRIKQINEQIKINNANIEKLKKYEKIQTDKFKSYDAVMYEQYFTNRYSKKTNAIKSK